MSRSGVMNHEVEEVYVYKMKLFSVFKIENYSSYVAPTRQKL